MLVPPQTEYKQAAVRDTIHGRSFVRVRSDAFSLDTGAPSRHHGPRPDSRKVSVAFSERQINPRAAPQRATPCAILSMARHCHLFSESTLLVIASSPTIVFNQEFPSHGYGAFVRGDFLLIPLRITFVRDPATQVLPLPSTQPNFLSCVTRNSLGSTHT